ncbi:hypothetical protein C5167_025578 [Papaver somniferum]|uniref:Uncharacterized protein n=1 Tax=Papaver somniferum TaxID=3469 RepID=A0A4Y7JRV5_PAPSO|nr:hypothetical protein C5167_025578 [Papaver somniferum]
MVSTDETKSTTTLSDARDYKGRPSDRSRSGGWLSAAMILVVELNERLTTLGIAVNLVTYLTGVMHLGNATSANAVTNFLGTSFMLCLLGGFIADTFLGRYLTIAIFTTVQAMGVTILTISTVIPSLHPPKCAVIGSSECVPATSTQLTVLYMALYLTALGTGGLKSSVSGFGSDQFDESDEKEKSQMLSFFSWFFFFISLGSLMAVSVLVYIQDNVGREWGYGSPLTQIATVSVAAWRKRHLELPSDSSLLFNLDDKVQDDGKKKAQKQKLPHSKQFRLLDKAAIKDTDVEKNMQHIDNKWCLTTLTDVEEVKMVVRMLPIWATTILFWTVHAQMATFSVSQAATLDRSIGKSFQIPAASLTVFFVGSTLLTVPIYTRLVAPICKKVLKNKHGLSPLQRIGVGLVFSVIGMSAAALTEIKRLHSARTSGLTNDPNATIPLTVFWLIPQFLIVGAGEAFIYTGQLDFFLRECPKGMKTMSTGLFLSTLSIGFFFSSLLVSIVHMITGDTHPWISDNLNQGKLYDFYWLLSGLSMLNFGAFLIAANWYVYKEARFAADGIELEEIDDHAPCGH